MVEQIRSLPQNNYIMPAPYGSIQTQGVHNFSTLNSQFTNAHPDNDANQLHKKRKTGATDEERKFPCKHCDKKYLSYPALYTHIKTKHKQLLSAPNNYDSAKKRGRPKKNPDDTSDTKVKTKEYFNDPEKKGTISDPLNVLEGELLSSSHQKDHPLYKCLERILPTYSNSPLQSADEKDKESTKETEKSKEKSKKVCDEVLAEYLAYTSKITNREFFQKIAKFVILYRDCFNMNDPNKSTIESAEKLPDKSNDFVTNYTQEYFSNKHAIELTQNLCEWLFVNSYTCLKLSLINRQ